MTTRSSTRRTATAGSGTSPQSKTSHSNTTKKFTCSICEEDVVDGRHSSIFCDGQCAAWLHHGCAGLAKKSLQILKKSSAPFLCSTCRLDSQAHEIDSLKADLSLLQQEVARLTTP